MAAQIYDGFMTAFSPHTTHYLFSDIYSIYISAGGHGQLRVLAWLFDTLLRWSHAKISDDGEGSKRRRGRDVGKEVRRGGRGNIVVMKESEGGGSVMSIGKKQRRGKTLCGHTLPCIDMIMSKRALGPLLKRLCGLEKCEVHWR